MHCHIVRKPQPYHNLCTVVHSALRTKDYCRAPQTLYPVRVFLAGLHQQDALLAELWMCGGVPCTPTHT